MEDLQYKYTIAQVYLFYEKEIKRHLDFKRDLAFIISYGVMMGTPSESRDDVGKKQRAWKEFISGLTWSDLERKAKVKPDPYKAFAQLTGILGKGAPETEQK